MGLGICERVLGDGCDVVGADPGDLAVVAGALEFGFGFDFVSLGALGGEVLCER